MTSQRLPHSVTTKLHSHGSTIVTVEGDEDGLHQLLKRFLTANVPLTAFVNSIRIRSVRWKVDDDEFEVAFSLSDLSDKSFESSSASNKIRDPLGKRFAVALSYPRERRDFVSQVVIRLASAVGRNRVLYDQFHEAEFARPRLAAYLGKLCRDDSELTAAFLCADYVEKEWCGLEWDALLDLIKRRRDHQLMLLRFDDAEIEGLYSIHGAVWVGERSAHEIAELILERLRLNGVLST